MQQDEVCRTEDDVEKNADKEQEDTNLPGGEAEGMTTLKGSRLGGVDRKELKLAPLLAVGNMLSVHKEDDSLRGRLDICSTVNNVY